jgi:hypothetical protein
MPDEGGEPVHFEGKALFTASHILGSATFDGAVFKQDAIFYRVEIAGDASFGSTGSDRRVRFAGPADFSRARIIGSLVFTGATFEQIATFSDIEIEGDAVFIPDERGNAVHFDGDAQFWGSKFKGQARFESAVFHSTTRFARASFGADTIFNGAHFRREACFDEIDANGFVCFGPAGPRKQATFEDKATFYDALFRSRSLFLGAQFCGECDFEGTIFEAQVRFGPDEQSNGGHFYKDAGFSRTKFRGPVTFQGTVFGGRTDFSAATAVTDAHFEDTTFASDARFRDASFSGVVFISDRAPRSESTKEKRQFRGNLDFQGFAYKRIRADLNSLVEAFEYDPQPCAQLENVLRASGKEREASNVYYKRKKHETRLAWKRVFRRGTDSRVNVLKSLGELPPALFRSFQGLLYRYGVRPYRLMVFPLLVIALGTFIFSRPGAVVDKNNQPPQEFSTHDAFDLSVRLFLPTVVGISVGSQWVPANKPIPLVKFSYAEYAALQQISGYILVPFGVLSLTGLLVRKAKS